MKNKIRVNDSFIASALRNGGYTNYTAIADIVDNSIEQDVESTFVAVQFETEKRNIGATITEILIIDDGNGMTIEELDEAMSLGSETGKNPILDFGMYGTGLKSASLSIGQVLEVYTKSKDRTNNCINYAKLSIEDAIANHGEILVDIRSCDENSEEYKKWEEKAIDKNGNALNKGTIVRISELDKLSNKDYQSFKNTLNKRLAETFNKEIGLGIHTFFIANKEVDYIDLMNYNLNRIVIKDEESAKIDVSDLINDGNKHIIKYKAYYFPKTEDKSGDDGWLEDSLGQHYLPRNSKNQGLYLYRNNRLVGKGLTLGIWNRESWFSGFRCELFFDGACDYLFGSTYTKIINEKNKTDMSQSFYDRLMHEIKPLANECKTRQQKEDASLTDDPVTQKEESELAKLATEELNSNRLVGVLRRGKNKKQNLGKNPPLNPRGKQKNPCPIRTRTEEWLSGYEWVHAGKTDFMWDTFLENNKAKVTINKDHAFYAKFLSKIPKSMQHILLKIMACKWDAREHMDYGCDEINDNIIRTYDSEFSTSVRKALEE